MELVQYNNEEKFDDRLVSEVDPERNHVSDRKEDNDSSGNSSDDDVVLSELERSRW